MSKEVNNKIHLRDYFHFTRYFKAMVYQIIFALLYSLGYLYLQRIPFNDAIRGIATVILLALYGLGMFFICSMMWKRKAGVLNGRSVLSVLLWNICSNLFFNYILLGFYQLAKENFILLLAIQSVAAALLIIYVPVTLLFYKGIYNDNQTSFKELVKRILEIVKTRTATLANTWLIFLFVMILIDSITGGPLVLMQGMNATYLFTNLVYLENPVFEIVYIVFDNLIGNPGVSELVMLCAMGGVLQLYLGANFIGFIGTLWPEKNNN